MRCLCKPVRAVRYHVQVPADLGKPGEELRARAGSELGEVLAQRDVAGLQPGPVRRVRRIQPAPVAEDPSP